MRRAGEVTYTDAHFRSGEGRGEVCFSNERDMKNCIEMMNGFEIKEKIIRVSRKSSRSRSKSPVRSSQRNRKRPHRTDYSIIIENLSSRCDWAELKDLMRTAGDVTYVDAHNRMGKGRGEACFRSKYDMENALTLLDKREINGKLINLSIKDHRRSRSRSRSGSR